MALNFLIALSLMVGMLALLEVLLSDAQKNAISDWTTSFWLKLASVQDAFKKLIYKYTSIITPELTHALFDKGGRLRVGAFLKILSWFLLSTIICLLVTWLARIAWMRLKLDLDYVGGVLVAVGFLVGFFFATVTALISAILTIMLFPIICMYLVAGCIATMEYLVRRVAEYAKGPIIAASLIAAGIFGMIKAFRP